MKFAVVTLCTDDWREFAEVTDANKKEYCDRHGYKFISKIGEPFYTRFHYGDPHLKPMGWEWGFERAFAFRDAFQSYPECDWVYFSDTDALITNHTRPLDKIVDNRYHIILAADINGTNCGNLFIRNSDIGRGFVDSMIGAMPAYRDKKSPPAWFGMDVWGATVCYNTIEGKKKNIPKPETWKDLLKPAYKGQIVMPNPASSGTGFFDVTAWLTLWGDDNGKGGGWKFMDGLHENIAQYTHSGSKPCNMAASGEYVVGISFEYRANTNKAKGAPIDLVFPKEGLGWDLEAFAIHKGTKHLAAAKKLADWASSKDAMKLYGKNFAITAQPGVAEPLANVPKDYEARLVKMDFVATAAARERVLDEWNKRYNAKSEPKK